ncbi:MAG TPA: hypothetical protein VN634_09850 [Candidatus Limnocylindrales bacterium]|nr:hypothetical protein [Candidatus Limnocylindrales bacterium]
MHEAPPAATSCAQLPSVCPHWPMQLAEFVPEEFPGLSSDGSSDGSSGGGFWDGSSTPALHASMQLERPVRHVDLVMVRTSLHPAMQSAIPPSDADERHSSLQSSSVGRAAAAQSFISWLQVFRQPAEA